MYYNFSTKKPRQERRPNKEEPLDKKGKITVLIGLIVLFVTAFGAFGLTALVQHLDPAPAPAPEPEPETPVVKVTDDLNYAFLSLEPPRQNLIYSPLSIKNGLSLLNFGAAGDTKAEITDILGDSLMLNTQNIADKLSLANAVFIRDTFKDSVRGSYITEATKTSNAEIVYDSFEDATNIDAWVSDKTFKLINTLGLRPDASTRMILVNALAIQLGWLHPFETSGTLGRPFTTIDGGTYDATTMSLASNADNIRYLKDDELSIISLPLQPAGNVNLEFIAIMPSTSSLDQYITDLDLNQLSRKLSVLAPASEAAGGIELFIPKFGFDYQLDFKKDLGDLGVTTAFTPDADFSNMAKEPLYVSDAIHKANIDFSEEGVKAAAVTATVMTVGSAMLGDTPEPVTLRFDHPFLFLIRDRENGTIWFTGTVYQPNLWSDDAASYQM